MNIVEFNRIQTIFTSLSTSADLTIAGSRCAAVWDTRNSPYKSHQHLTFHDCAVRHAASGQSIAEYAVLLCNKKYDCALDVTDQFPVALYAPSDGDLVAFAKYTDTAYELHSVMIPPSIIPAKLSECINLVTGHELATAGLVRITFTMRKVASWGEDGKPVFVALPHDEGCECGAGDPRCQASSDELEEKELSESA